MLQCVGVNGMLIQCLTPDPSNTLDPDLTSPNVTVYIAKVTDAINRFMEKSDEEKQALLINMKSDNMTKVRKERFDIVMICNLVL